MDSPEISQLVELLTGVMSGETNFVNENGLNQDTANKFIDKALPIIYGLVSRFSGDEPTLKGYLQYINAFHTALEYAIANATPEITFLEDSNETGNTKA